MMSEPTLVSVIVPAYNEEDTLSHFVSEITKLHTNEWGDTFEFVVVDDGSTDQTWQKLLDWQDEESRLTLVRLAGNRGALRAARAGLEAASGDVMVFVPADLQEGIDLVHMCLDMWHASGAPVVMMVPKHGRIYDRMSDGLAARIFYFALRLSTNFYGPLSVRAQVKLMDRVTAKAFVQGGTWCSMRTPFVLRHKFPYEVVHYQVKRRTAGRSKWTLAKKLALAQDFFIETSTWLLSPWRIAVAGLAVFTVLAILSRLLPSVCALLATLADVVFAAVVLMVLSILGAHIARIHRDLRDRPVYVVRDIRPARLLSERETLLEPARY